MHEKDQDVGDDEEEDHDDGGSSDVTFRDHVADAAKGRGRHRKVKSRKERLERIRVLLFRNSAKMSRSVAAK